ncbi:MAG: amidohydrolase family protein, partial [Dethiobacteria bacterium]|nr:amidohydrolase family protein [Dethiobacteria bacterium]
VEKHHYWSLICDGPEEVRKAVRRLLREGADQIKVLASGGDNYETDRNCDLHYSLEELKMAINEAKMIGGTMVCIHCESLESARLAVEAGADTIEHGEVLDDELAEMMAQKGIILVPTMELLVNWHETFKPAASEKTRAPIFLQRTTPLPDDISETSRQKIIANFQMAMAKGVKIALGSDAVFEPVTPYGLYSAKELNVLKICGMNESEALTAATKTAAEALGLSHKIGTIEEGKYADYLLLDQNPLNNLEIFLDNKNIKAVVLEGTTVAMRGILLS